MQLRISDIIKLHPRRVACKARGSVNALAKRIRGFDVTASDFRLGNISLDKVDSGVVPGFHSLFQGFGSLSILSATGNHDRTLTRQQGYSCASETAGSPGDQHNTTRQRSFVKCKIEVVCQAA